MPFAPCLTLTTMHTYLSQVASYKETWQECFPQTFPICTCDASFHCISILRHIMQSELAPVLFRMATFSC